MQRMLKVTLPLLVFGLMLQEANAFGHCRWGRGCGYIGCGYGGWGYGYGGYGGWYSRFAGPVYGGTVYAPVYLGSVYGPVPAVAVGPALASPQLTSYAPYTAATNQVLLTVNVPADAKLTVNGKATRTPGEHRRFVSSNLPANQTHTYLVRAEFVRDGKIVNEERKIQIATGNSGSVTFGDSSEQIANTRRPDFR